MRCTWVPALLVFVLASIAPATGPTTLLAAQPAAAPGAGAPKVLRMGVSADPRDLDPQSFGESVSSSIILHIHNTLFELDKNFTPVPALAESAQVSADGLTWTIKLKKGIKFHDGTPFTAGAVKAVVDRTLSDKPPVRSAMIGRNDLASARVVDDYTAEIKTKKPLGPFLYMLAGPAWAINSPAAFKKYGDQATKHPVGTGPYRFVEWKPNEQIVLERNPDYWGPKPYYDQLIYRIIPEAGTRVALLETGEVDLAVNIPPTELPRLEQNAKLTAQAVKLNRIMYIGINCQLPYLSDKRVRQAFNYAVDKRAIIKGIVRGLGEEAVSPIPRLNGGFAEAGKYAYDPAKAKQLLAEAGVSRDFKVSLWIPQGRYFQGEAIGQAVANYLREVGINVGDQVLEYGTYNTVSRKPFGESQVQMYLLGWSSDNLDADIALTPVFHSSQWPPTGPNRGFYKNPQVDQLLDTARATTDAKRRNDLYAQAQKIIWDDAPWIFLLDMQNPIAYRKGITGLSMWPTEILDLRQAKE